MESAEEYFTLMGSAFENFRRTTAVQTDGGFLEGEGIGPIRSDLPQFGVVRERTVVRGRVRAFDFFSLGADLFPVALNDEAGSEWLSRGEGFGKSGFERTIGNGD